MDKEELEWTRRCKKEFQVTRKELGLVFQSPQKLKRNTMRIDSSEGSDSYFSRTDRKKSVGAGHLDGHKLRKVLMTRTQNNCTGISRKGFLSEIKAFKYHNRCNILGPSNSTLRKIAGASVPLTPNLGSPRPTPSLNSITMITPTPEAKSRTTKVSSRSVRSREVYNF